MTTMPGSITVPKSLVFAHYAQKGLDAIDMAMEYIQAWQAAVEPGELMPVAGMKCALADGFCGCPGEAFVTHYKCTGPYPPVPFEILKNVLLAGLVEGVKAQWCWGPYTYIEDGHLHSDEFVLKDHPVLYVEKLS